MIEVAGVKDRVLTGVAWAAVTRFVGQLLNWSMTIFVMHLLQPKDYGLMATAMAVTGLVSTIYVGFTDALVQARKLDDAELRKTFGLILAINGALALALCAGSWSLAGLYDEPRLAPLLQVASLSPLLMAFSSVSRAQLDRELSLKLTSRIEMSSIVLGGVATLALAWAGCGVWALMGGTLFGLAWRSLGLWVAAPFHHWPLFSLRGIQPLLHFSGYRVVEHVLWYLSTQVDVFLVGGLLGPHSLGVYSVSRTIAGLPADKIATVVKPVGMPAFARLQDDRVQAFGFLLKATGLLALATFPVFFGLAAVATEFVPVVLGPRWEEAVLPLTILSVGMALRPAGMILPSFLMAVGEVRASFFNTFNFLLIFTLAYAIGSLWGLIAVCIAGAVAYPFQFLWLVRRIATVTGQPSLRLLAAPVRPLLCAALMVLIVTMARRILPDGIATATRLGLLVGIGVIAYCASALVLCRPIIADGLSVMGTLAPGGTRWLSQLSGIKAGRT